MTLAVWAAFLGGAFGWIVRSIFDIFYLARRDRDRAINLVRADLESIEETSLALRQEEFFVALRKMDKVGVEFVDRLFITASVRAADTDTRVLDRMGDVLLRLEPDLQSDIISTYRLLVTCRLLSDRLFQHFEAREYEKAVDIANHLVDLIARLKKKAAALLIKLR